MGGSQGMDLHYPTVLSVKPKGLRITYCLIKLKKLDVMPHVNVVTVYSTIVGFIQKLTIHFYIITKEPKFIIYTL